MFPNPPLNAVEKVGNVILPAMASDAIPSLRRKAITVFMEEWKKSGKLGQAYISCKRFIDQNGIGLTIV